MWMAPCLLDVCYPLGTGWECLMCVPQGNWCRHFSCLSSLRVLRILAVVHALKWLGMEILHGGVFIIFKSFFFCFWQYFLILDFFPVLEIATVIRKRLLKQWLTSFPYLFSSSYFQRNFWEAHQSELTNILPAKTFTLSRKQMSNRIISAQVSLIHYWGNIKSDEYWKN